MSVRENLPRILDHAMDGAVVVSLYDDTVVYSNPIARTFFPHAIEDAPLTDVLTDMARREGYITSLETSGYGALKADPELAFAVNHLPIRGGLWNIGSRLPEVSGFPPTAIFTFTAGDKQARVPAFSSHVRTALGARIALELDETKRDIVNALLMLTQANKRVESLTEALVSAATSYGELLTLQDLDTLSTG